MVVTVGNAVRDGWLVVGLSLVLLLGLEAAYRSQGAVRRTLGLAADWPTQSDQSEDPLHPYADAAWWRDFQAERDSLRFEWEPYSYSRMQPTTGEYLNVDSAGRRVTPDAEGAVDGSPLRVFFLGGSTTLGFADRDAHTRPAVTARLLAEAGFRPEVTNFGQLGWVSAQEAVALAFALRAGDIPDVVVFWDGLNDMNSMRDHGVPGWTFREEQRARGFEEILRLDAAGGRVEPGRAVRSILRYSQLWERVSTPTERPPHLALPPAETFCRAVTDYWVGIARLVEGLAEGYGFEALMVWQPTWETSGRPRSDFETSIEGTTRLAQHYGMEDHAARCAQMIDEVVASGNVPSIRNWARLHDADPETVFIDEYGHTTERATAVEARAVTEEILRLLERR